MQARLHLAPAPGSDHASPAAGRIRVVLADDHLAVRRNLKLLLDREDDFTVIAEASDLTAVRHHVHGQLPHVLVLDLSMPNGSSLATIRQLRERAPDTEIVVLTMETSSAVALQALNAGAVGLVLKERAESDLPLAVRAAVMGEEFVSPPVAVHLDALRAAPDADPLSRRELEVVRLIALGYTSAEIGRQLHLSRRTIESHRARIHRKLGLRTRAELVSYALGRHLLDI